MKWEYFATTVAAVPFYSGTSPDMNRLGSEGWEMIWIDPSGSVIFKRELKDEDKKQKEKKRI